MSRMTKYLKQKCSLEQLVRDPDTQKPVLDAYGEPQHQPPQVRACRREKVIKDVYTATGSIIRVDTRYYLDGSLFVDAGDRVDGRDVIGVEEYTNEYGEPEGYLVYVS